MIDRRRTARSRGTAWSLACLLTIAATIGALMTGCNSNSEPISATAASGQPDCLPAITLTNQYGQPVLLSSLKGKPVLFDFIYTTCPGPCLVLTARMKAIADNLGPDLGAKARFVSVTVDPEHDHPAVMHAYAKEQGAERPGWLFLTGSPADIDALMAQFKLKRQREADGSVDHVLEFFLVGADGHQIVQYLVSDVNPAKVAGDLREVIDGKQLAAL